MRLRSSSASSTRTTGVTRFGRWGWRPGSPSRTLGKVSWAFLTRSGSERDLLEELGTGERLAEGIVRAERRPRRPDGSFEELGFARQALEVRDVVTEGGPEELADVVARAMRSPPKGFSGRRWALQIVAADGRDPHDPRRTLAGALEEVLPEALRARLSPEMKDLERPAAEAEHLIQVWIVSEAAAFVGLTSTRSALTHHPGGKPRLRRPESAVSRAGLKLEEALEWLGVGPEKGDSCIDLGAAPGGWTQVALTKGARVLAVDPAQLKLPARSGHLRHVQMSAFRYTPDETLDWLLCDMAWRPLEVAQLLGKWGRRGWARQLIANFKLPMKRKADMVRQLLEVLAGSGWQGLRRRQLYHDRDEITVAAWLDPRIVARGPQPAFRMRSRDPTAARPDANPRKKRRPPSRRR